MRISLQSSILNQKLFDILNVETIRIMDGRVIFDNSSDLTSIFLDKMGSPVSDCTEALNDEGLIFDSLR